MQRRLRVEAVPASPIRWLRRIWSINDEELTSKCGLDGYFFIRLLRAMILIFVPSMCIIVPTLLPINFHKGKSTNEFTLRDQTVRFNVTGLDTLSWQNVSPPKTRRYWGHLVCAVLIIAWSLYRIYCEKLNFIDVRQKFLTSPEHRLKASARTVLVTNIPAEYRSVEALEALYDVFVDNDDRSRLIVWVNRDYSSLRGLVKRLRSLRHKLEKAELKISRRTNTNFQKNNAKIMTKEEAPPNSNGMSDRRDPTTTESIASVLQTERIALAFERDCDEIMNSDKTSQSSSPETVTIVKQENGIWQSASKVKFWIKGTKKTVPKIAWLRFEIARLTIEIESLLQNLDDDNLFPKQNSAFIQFDRQMAAHMCCALVSHDKAGRMAPRYLEVAPHEVLWPNMNVTSLARVLRSSAALVLFAVMLFLWGIPTTVLATLSQLDSLRASVTWLQWLRNWPSWVVSLISGK